MWNNNFKYHHTSKEAFNPPAVFAAAAAAADRAATESENPDAAARLAGSGYIGWFITTWLLLTDPLTPTPPPADVDFDGEELVVFIWSGR